MRQRSKSIIKKKETWQENYSQELTDDDASEITANLVGFFSMLQEWRQGLGNSEERDPKQDGSDSRRRSSA